MKRWLVASGMLAVAFTATQGAEENFSKTLRPEEHVAAGLAKLSPAELARLDALVRDYKSGALERARREAAAAEARAAKAETEAIVQAERLQKKGAAEAPGLLAKAKVMLTPGTEVEYGAVESRIVGEFRGWEARTIFVLENGQRWQVTGGDSYVAAPAVRNPAVKITPGMLGSFWLSIEGVKSRVKVVPVGGR